MAAEGDSGASLFDPHALMGPGLRDYTFASTWKPPPATFGTMGHAAAATPPLPVQGPTNPWDAADLDGCAWNNDEAVNHVPVVESGPGGGTGSNLYGAWPEGDVLPFGPSEPHGADPCGDVWAPSVIRHDGQYLMHYTASRLNSDQKCIYHATSDYIDGPYKTQGQTVCHPSGRWTIDPYTFQSGDGLYMTYRDDEITGVEPDGQSAIAVVRLNDDGTVVSGTRRALLRSTDITWGYAPRTATNVVENPALIRSEGRYKLFFSGNDWATNAYGTGIADCGTSPLPTTPCTVLESPNRPYFGYRGPGATTPFLDLPTNQVAPGAMTPYKSGDGWRAVWHTGIEPMCQPVPELVDPWNCRPSPDRHIRNARLSFPTETPLGIWKVGRDF